MWLNNFGIHSKTPLNTLKLTVFEVIIFHENIELLPSCDSSDIYPSNNYTTEGAIIVRVGTPFTNQIVWVYLNE